MSPEGFGGDGQELLVVLISRCWEELGEMWICQGLIFSSLPCGITPSFLFCEGQDWVRAELGAGTEDLCGMGMWSGPGWVLEEEEGGDEAGR